MFVGGFFWAGLPTHLYEVLMANLGREQGEAMSEAMPLRTAGASRGAFSRQDKTYI
jgi:hypothetical protein